MQEYLKVEDGQPGEIVSAEYVERFGWEATEAGWRCQAAEWDAGLRKSLDASMPDWTSFTPPPTREPIRLTDEERETLERAQAADYFAVPGSGPDSANLYAAVETILASRLAAARAEGAAEALEQAADEQERHANGPRAMGNKAVAFKRIIFAEWLRLRAAEFRQQTAQTDRSE